MTVADTKIGSNAIMRMDVKPLETLLDNDDFIGVQIDLKAIFEMPGRYGAPQPELDADELARYISVRALDGVNEVLSQATHEFVRKAMDERSRA